MLTKLKRTKQWLVRPLVPIPPERIKEQIGSLVHVEGWDPGAVFRLVCFGPTGISVIQTPKTGKLFHCLTSRLCYVKRNEPKPIKPKGRKPYWT